MKRGYFISVVLLLVVVVFLIGYLPVLTSMIDFYDNVNNQSEFKTPAEGMFLLKAMPILIAALFILFSFAYARGPLGVG